MVPGSGWPDGAPSMHVTRKIGDECNATRQESAEGRISVDLAALAFDASPEIGGAGAFVSRQGRVSRCRHGRCRSQLRFVYAQTGAAFEAGARLRAFAADGEAAAANVGFECERSRDRIVGSRR